MLTVRLRELPVDTGSGVTVSVGRPVPEDTEIIEIDSDGTDVGTTVGTEIEDTTVSDGKADVPEAITLETCDIIELPALDACESIELPALLI